MKRFKYLFTGMLLATTGIVSAQNYGIEAGYVSSTINTNEAITGFQAGPVAEVKLAGPLNFEYGFKYQLLFNTEEHALGTSTYNGHFIQMPLRLKLAFPLSRDFSIFAFGGPNLDFGLEEQVVTITPIFGSEVKTTIHQYEIDADDNGEPDYSRFNLQLGVGGGIRYHNLQVKAGYDWGMTDLHRASDTQIKRNQLTLSLGFLF
jgi:hypothetical protein